MSNPLSDPVAAYAKDQIEKNGWKVSVHRSRGKNRKISGQKGFAIEVVATKPGPSPKVIKAQAEDWLLGRAEIEATFLLARQAKVRLAA